MFKTDAKITEMKINLLIVHLYNSEDNEDNLTFPCSLRTGMCFFLGGGGCLMSLVCIKSIFTDFSPYKNVLLTQNNTEFISKKQFTLLFYIFIYQRFSKMHEELFNFSL